MKINSILLPFSFVLITGHKRGVRPLKEKKKQVAMKTVLYSLVLLTGILAAAGCEDDRLYPTSLNNRNQKDPDLYVKVPVHMESEFDAILSTNFYHLGDDPYFDELLWWLIGDLNDSVCNYELEGTGRDSVLGRFTFQISTSGSLTQNYSFTRAKLCSSSQVNGWTMYLSNDDKTELAEGNPYRRPGEKSFIVEDAYGVSDYYAECISILLSESENCPDSMNVKITGDFTLIISKR